ncbi:ribonuclease III [Mycolicibacterium sp. 624]|uniref:ribonuclease III n=1 Tax=Mycolicibacterium sp. 624 TaxID=3156314 RepID=UPI00339B3B44
MTADRTPLLEALGVDLPEDILTVALTHRSYAFEHGGLPTNERMEFLGDAVLGLLIADILIHRHPDSPEGELAKLRNSIVNTQALANVGRGLTDTGLGSFLLLGRGEVVTGGHDKASILADGVEALLGAVYLQHGFDVSRDVVLRLFSELLDTAPSLGAALEWKSSLQELAVARGLGMPKYVVTSDGPDHDRVFTASVLVNGQEYGSGVGTSKKEAEVKAAAQAWTALDSETVLDSNAAGDSDPPPTANA